MNKETKNMQSIGRGTLYDTSTGEPLDSTEQFGLGIEPEDARDFVEHHLRFGTYSPELVPVSIKLPVVTNSVLENNASVLGMNKSDLHRKALEIGLNEITKEYCALTKQPLEIKE